MLGSRRYGKSERARKNADLKFLNCWLNLPHENKIGKKVMDVVREGRSLLDWMDSKGFFVKRLSTGKLIQEPRIESVHIYRHSAKLRRLMRELQFVLWMRGFDAMEPNAMWLDIRPRIKNPGVWVWLHSGKPFAIPSDRRQDADAWTALAIIMQIAPQGNFPQRCSAPRAKDAGDCGNWFVKLTPEHSACSVRCRQRKREATDEYKEWNAAKVRKWRERKKEQEEKWLAISKREGGARAKKR